MEKRPKVTPFRYRCSKVRDGGVHTEGGTHLEDGRNHKYPLRNQVSCSDIVS